MGGISEKMGVGMKDEKKDSINPETYFRDKFNTPLSPDEEAKFGDWVKSESEKQKRDITMDMNDYDVKGYWKESVLGGDKSLHNETTGHGSDKFKKPSHPGFSNESIYSNAEYPGGQWNGNEFTPGAANLKLWSPKDLKARFDMQQRGLPLDLAGRIKMPDESFSTNVVNKIRQ